MRLDLAIQRAMSKDPEDRFESMAAFVEELDACLTEVDGRGDEGATMIVPAARPQRRRSPRQARPLMPWLLAAIVAVAVAAGAFLLLNDDDGGVLPGGAASERVQLSGNTIYDPPPGDQAEHVELVAEAADGDSTTAWKTESYRDFGKEGVGLVLRAPRLVALSRMTVVGSGGFEAKIRASNSPTGGFVDVSGDWQQVGERTTFEINTNDKEYAYYMVWLRLPTSGGQAQIYEVTART